MFISYAIMAHPSRLDDATALSKWIGGDVVFDFNGDGEVKTGDRAWGKAVLPDSDWHVVLQDDALLLGQEPDSAVAFGFRYAVEQALACRADLEAVSLYVGTGRPRQRQVREAIKHADRKHLAWLESTRMMWGVGVAMPRHLYRMFLARDWQKASPHPNTVDAMPYDERLTLFLQMVDARAFYTWPSLIDHRDGRSLIPRFTTGPILRHAHRVGVALDYTTAASPVH